jgi:signal transduction histidine kinase/ActR/RegA family two-component response regulator
VESSNEELTSSNEELINANEELQATNEELQASQEELRAVNEELACVNGALRDSEARVRRKLASLLSPEGNLGDLELGDILNIPAIQSLLEDYHRLVRITLAIVDLKGNVLVGVGWQDVCTKFHRVHPSSCQHCIQSDTLLSRGVAPGEFRLYECQNHMWDVATPILVGDLHVGNLFTGQFFFEGESLNRDLFRAQAAQYGFSEEEYLAAVDAVPRLSREAVNTNMAFLGKLAQMISQLSYSNIRLVRSLTERDALTQSLRESEEDLNRAQSVARTGSWRIDLRNNRLWWSDETYRIFGVPKGAHLTYEMFLSAVHPDDRARVDRCWQSAIAGKPYDVEHRIVVGNQVKWVRELAELEFDESDLLLGGFGTVQDVTRRRESEEALKAAMLAAEAANQARGQFLANMSHELRTPMSAILGMTDLALGENLPEQVRDYLQTACNSADMLLSILNEILDFSRIESGKLALEAAAFRLRPLVQETIKALSIRAWEKGLCLHCDIADDVPDSLVGDTLRLRQILVNLVGNAIKFTSQGQVLVRASLRSQADAKACIQFVVEDTGIGIASAQQKHIFAPFAQADSSTTREYGGTGLGLAIAANLVRMMGGEIDVASELGRGSTFTFTLHFPLAGQQALADAAERSSRVDGFPPARRLRVLLVEDTPSLQKLIVAIVRKRGHEIEVAANGQEAVEVLCRHKPDVVLMDVQMPVMDGFQATAAIRALDNGHHNVPIIAMTAHAMKGDQERCLSAGMDAYLAKPVDRQALIAAIERLAPAECPEDSQLR